MNISSVLIISVRFERLYYT